MGIFGCFPATKYFIIFLIFQEVRAEALRNNQRAAAAHQRLRDRIEQLERENASLRTSIEQLERERLRQWAEKQYAVGLTNAEDGLAGPPRRAPPARIPELSAPASAFEKQIGSVEHLADEPSPAPSSKSRAPAGILKHPGGATKAANALTQPPPSNSSRPLSAAGTTASASSVTATGKTPSSTAVANGIHTEAHGIGISRHAQVLQTAKSWFSVESAATGPTRECLLPDGRVLHTLLLRSKDMLN